MNPLPDHVDIAIVGAGVVGTALAAVLSRSELSVLVLERADDVCEGTSKANTAVLHTGFDCVPGSLESQLVTRGYGLLGEYAEHARIAVERTGALLVAWDAEQLGQLEAIAEKAAKNGIHDTRIVGLEELRAREPHLGPEALGALEVPGESIIDPWSPVLAFALEAVANGAVISLTTEVLSAAATDDGHLLTTSKGTVRCSWLLNAAGLDADLLNVDCGHDEFHVTPRRGELIVYDKSARSLVSSIILPVPTATTKGVLVSPTVFGNVLLGPTADDLEDRRATGTTGDGLTRLQLAGSRLVPELEDHEVTATYAGLRAATEHRDYQLHAHPEERYVCIGGIRSTGLTASLAIAEYVADLLVDAGLETAGTRGPAQPPLMPPLGQAQRRASEDPEAIAENPAFGALVCHCEGVSKGEIENALQGELGARSSGGLRRRTRAMNGRCQGFYCSAVVLEMLSHASGLSLAELTGSGRP